MVGWFSRNYRLSFCWIKFPGTRITDSELLHIIRELFGNYRLTFLASPISFQDFSRYPKVTLPSNIYFLSLSLFLFFTQKEFLYERVYTKTNITLAKEDRRHHPRAGHVMNTNATPAIFTEVTIELLRLARSCSRNLAAGHYAISLEHRSLLPSTTSTAVSTISSSSFRVRSALSASGNTETRSSF